MIPVSGNKIYVDVVAEFSYNGEIRPIRIGWHDGRKFDIDRILDCRKSAEAGPGGIGVRYTCMICGRRRYLFYGENNRWFVQRRG